MPPSLGRSGPAGTLRLPLGLLWPRPGVIITHAAHRRPPGWRRWRRSPGGVTRFQGNSAEPRRSPSRRAGPGRRWWRQLRARDAGWPVPGMVVQAPGLDNTGTGPVRAVLFAAGGL